ncbi:MAG TPA: DUF5666 domain-containing protein [Ktedonobacterales bacterium]|nr:DUF5666 domain-containing protein [Ktedonobacterales bacterium]
MTFIRSRLALTLIGLVIIGGFSAALAAMTAPHPFQTALIGAGQTSSAIHSTATATYTAAASAPGGASTGAPAAPTNPPQPAPTARATTPPATGQYVDLHTVVASVNTSAGAFSVTVNGSSMTVIVTGSTIFDGDVRSLSGLRAGQKAEVKGTIQADGSLLASDVNADSGN